MAETILKTARIAFWEIFFVAFGFVAVDDPHLVLIGLAPEMTIEFLFYHLCRILDKPLLNSLCLGLFDVRPSQFSHQLQLIEKRIANFTIFSPVGL